MGCNSESQKIVELNPDSTIEVNQENKDYLSITNTEYVNGKDTADGMVMKIYTYDIQSKTLTERGQLPYNSQYPLTFVSLDENTIYYSAAEDDKDELFSYNIDTKVSQKLSSGLFAINSIIADTNHDALILAAVKKGERPVKVMFYDKDHEQLDIWGDSDLDTTTWDISYNQENGKIYAAQYSEYEQEQQIKEANEKQKALIPPDNRVTEIDPENKKERKIIELDNEQILTLSASGDQVLIATAKLVNRSPTEYSIVNIRTGKRTPLQLSINANSKVELTKDGQGFYFLGDFIKNSAKQIRGIYYYNLETNEIESIFLQENGFINNFTLVN